MVTWPDGYAPFTDNHTPILTGLNSTTGDGPVAVAVNPLTGAVIVDAVFGGTVMTTPSFSLDPTNASPTPAFALLDTNYEIVLSPLSEVGTTPALIKVGQTISNTSAVQLTATSIISTNGILVQGLSANTANVYIGNSSVTTSTGFQLQAGQAVPFTCSNINQLYVIGANNTDGVCWNVL